MQDKSAAEEFRIKNGFTIEQDLFNSDVEELMTDFSTQQNASINNQLEEAKELLELSLNHFELTNESIEFSKLIKTFLNKPK